MLTVDSAPDYLFETGLIARQTVLDGDLDVVSVTRRNANFQVSTRNGGLLVKQPADLGVGLSTLRTETCFYAYCRDNPALAGVQERLPRLLHEDRSRGLLVLELLEGTVPLWRYYRDRGGDAFPVELAGRVGRLLGWLHDLFAAAAASGPPPDFLGSGLPWALDLHRPTPEKLSRMSAAHFELVRLLQDDAEVVRRLNRLRRNWRATSIVHGDVKMDNFLVSEAPADGAADVFLIDWELVQLGDPAWDLGGALQDFVFWWVLGMPHDRPLEDMVAEARYPLDSLQPGIDALWRGYRTARRLDEPSSERLLADAVDYSAARILQTAAEIASKYQRLPAPAVLMSQIGVNLLTDPETGRAELYGLHELVEGAA